MPAPIYVEYKGQTFTLGQLERATGICSETLSAWHRSFGRIESRIDKTLAERAEHSCLVRLAAQHGVSRSAWAKRVQRGKDPVDAATTPTRPRAKRSGVSQ